MQKGFLLNLKSNLVELALFQSFLGFWKNSEGLGAFGMLNRTILDFHTILEFKIGAYAVVT